MLADYPDLHLADYPRSAPGRPSEFVFGAGFLRGRKVPLSTP